MANRKEYCIEALESVNKLGLQEYILIDWRDILGVNINDLESFKFTHLMTSASVSKLFSLRLMQVGIHLRIPTLMSRVSVQAVQKEYHVLDSLSNQIQHVHKFCDAELQRESADDAKERRNVALVETNIIGPLYIKRIHGAIINEMKQVLLNHYGRLDKSTNTWFVKGKLFPETWSSIFESFKKSGDKNIFNASARNNSIVFQFEPMPHVVRQCLQIKVDDMIRYSEHPDEFFSFVQEFFANAFSTFHFFLLAKEHVEQLNVGTITDTVSVHLQDEGEENENRVRQRKEWTHKCHKITRNF